MYKLGILLLFGLLIVGRFNPVTSAAVPPATSTPTASFFQPGSRIVIPRPTPGPITTGNQIQFLVQSYQGRNRCLDYTPGVNGSAVVLNDCGRAHPVQVQEINDRHEVLLWAGNLVIGLPTLRVILTNNTSSPTEYALELQAPADLMTSRAAGQIFALDGDSIILASNRNLVAQVQNAHGAIGTPLVVGPRNLADNEFWDFKSTDGVDRDPTSGFIRVSNRDELLQAITQTNQLAQNNNGAAWGSVIKIMDMGQPIDLSYNAYVFCDPSDPYLCDYDPTNKLFIIHNLLIPTGVTIRGDRRGTLRGPLLRGNYRCLGQENSCEYDNIFNIQNDNVRITGLRLQGPSDCIADPGNCHQPPDTKTLHDAYSIHIGLIDSTMLPEPTGILIDHNEMFDWIAAVRIDSNKLLAYGALCSGEPDLSLNNHVQIDDNFIHHDENSDGYGVSLYNGGTASIRGNIFLMNRHAIATDGEIHVQYTAFGNMVLSNVPVYDGKKEQDFDMHATGNDPTGTAPGTKSHIGGYAGSQVDIRWNTFFGGGRDNFELRGQPCNTVDQFIANVSMQNNENALLTCPSGANTWDDCRHVTSSGLELFLYANQFGVSNPANHLGVGDFDGNGLDDLFLATGAAWYYAPGGKTEWRFLSAKTDTINRLLFGDFDADGRTDVVGVDPQDNLSVSWGGISDWEKLNTSIKIDNADPLTDWFATADFDGDGRADIFYADGHIWRVSYGGSAPFMEVQTSNLRIKNIRFGDFNKDGTTDVFSVVDNAWKVSYSPKSTHGLFSNWTFLRSKLTDTAGNLVVADFNGDGYADIAYRPGNCNFCMGISYSGTQDGIVVAIPAGLSWVAVGKFVNAQADILVWNNNSACHSNSNTNNALCIVQAGTQNIQPYSIQDMR